MKKQIIASVLGCVSFIQLNAQSITSARGAVVGSNVTVKGKIINGGELGSIRFMQDGVAGISIYGASLSTLNRGDSVIANGTLTSYNNLFEINLVLHLKGYHTDFTSKKYTNE